MQYPGIGTVDADNRTTHQHVTTADSAIFDRLLLILASPGYHGSLDAGRTG